MSKLAGVASVAFDCKTATVAMKPDAKLERAAIETALKAEGFGVSDVTEHARPLFVVVRAQLRPIEGEGGGKSEGAVAAATLAEVAAALPRELRSIEELFVEPDGRFTALLKVDAAADEAAFAEALKRRQLAAADFEQRRWPQGAGAAVVTLRSTDEAAKLRARAAFEKVDGVLAALAGAGATLVVFTPEPCPNLESKLKTALPPDGAELARVEARTPKR